MKSYKLLLILSSLASSLLITSCNSSSEKEAVPGIDSPKQRMDDSMPQAEEGLDNEDLEMLIRNFFLAYDTANNDDDFNQYLFDYYSRELWSKYREQEGETPYQYIRKTHYIP